MFWKEYHKASATRTCFFLALNLPSCKLYCFKKTQKPRNHIQGHQKHTVFKCLASFYTRADPSAHTFTWLASRKILESKNIEPNVFGIQQDSGAYIMKSKINNQKESF